MTKNYKTSKKTFFTVE